MVLSDTAAVVGLLLVSLMHETEYSGIFFQLFRWPETYLLVFFCTFAFVLWDFGTVMTNAEIRQWKRERKHEANVLARVKDKKDNTSVRDKVSQEENRGFAFSQEPGHDRLVTDSLMDRF